MHDARSDLLFDDRFDDRFDDPIAGSFGRRLEGRFGRPADLPRVV